jgi:tetratricopeptide (TPR) repeat protein
MALGIKRGTVLTTALLTVLLPIQSGLGKERSESKAPLVAEIAFQYAATERSQAAVKILDQALSLTETMSSDCYKATPLMRVANGYELVGQTSKGQQLLTKSFQIARTQTIANCTLSATSPEESLLNRAGEYAKAGYYNFALPIIRGVDNGFRPITMVRIAAAYQKDQKPDQARQILDEAIAIAQRNPDLRSRRQILLGMAFELKRTGQSNFLLPTIQQALESIRAQPQSQEDKSWDITQKLQISEMLIANGQKPQAIALLDPVLPEIEALQLTQFPFERVQLLTKLAIQYAAVGQSNQAKTVLAIAQSRAQALKPSPLRNPALAQVASGYAQIGQLQTARELTGRIKTHADRERVFQAIAMHYVKAGEVDQAVKVARSLSTAKNLTLSEIVRHYLANQQYDQALQIAQRERVQGILSEVALAYAEAGKPERAKQIVQSIQPPSGDSAHLDWLMPALAQSFAQSGQFEQALRVAQATQTKEYKSRALTAIATQYRAKDQVTNRAKAIEILDQALQVALSIK